MGDLRLAFRALRKQPGFTAVAVLTLAFGIGVNTSLFAILNAYYLQPLPVRDAARLVLVMQRSDVINLPYGQSYPDYLDYRRESKTFSDLAAYMPMPVHLSARGQTPERTWIEVVSPNYFALAGVAAETTLSSVDLRLRIQMVVAAGAAASQPSASSQLRCDCVPAG